MQMEYGSRGGSGSGGDHDAPDSQRRKMRYHRHTAHQIQKLESLFKECPHPDEKQRSQLSRELGLAPRQIKFWFQNRRTQMKAQHERADNCALRSENDKIRCENIAIREALKNIICPSCGGPPVSEDPYFDEQKLRIENAQLREELDRVSGIASKCIGRPITQLPPIHPIRISSLDLCMGSYGNQGIGGPSLDLDLLPGSCAVVHNLPFQPSLISGMDKSHMKETAANAMEELLRLVNMDDPLWIKSSDGRDVLKLDVYESMFPRRSSSSQVKMNNLRTESSRNSGVVIMNCLALVDMFMDCNKWTELFPTIVSAAKTIEVVSSGMMGNHSGSLQLMYEELHVLSPLVATREFCVLRYCEQIEQGSWAIVNVSYDVSQFGSQYGCHKLPSGCLIQEMPNGYSKVTWVEHVEIEDKAQARLYRDIIHGGLAFGAGKWVSTLQRMCERYACVMVSSTSTRDIGGVIPTLDGKRSMMRLAQRMVSNFCMSVSTSNSHRWTTVSNMNEVGVRITAHKSTDPGQPNGMVLSASTTVWVPVAPQLVFSFFKDERSRAQWDVLSNGNPVQEVAHIGNGSHPGNCISVLRALHTSQNNMLILQESCIDTSGSLVVYCPVDLQSINLAMSGEDPSCIPLLPSGFSITPDGSQSDHEGGGGGGASTSCCLSSANAIQGEMGKSGGGSLITVAFQILVSSLPSAKLNMDSVATINNLINTSVQQIKTALNCL